VSLKRWAALLLAVGFAYAGGRGCGGAERHARDGGHLPAGHAGAPAAGSPRAGGGATATPRSSPEVETEGTVVRVRDGDSIVVKRGGIGIEVRLDGIDCPELAQAFGKKAKNITSGLAFGKTVRLVGKGKDRYDRELAEVFLPDGRSLNRELVAAGFAWWYRKYSKDRTLEALEQEARKARRGLWADRSPVPPWEFRANNPR
jgi:endonuclease YncB( thermonuclease family)